MQLTLTPCFPQRSAVTNKMAPQRVAMYADGDSDPSTVVDIEMFYSPNDLLNLYDRLKGNEEITVELVEVDNG